MRRLRTHIQLVSRSIFHDHANMNIILMIEYTYKGKDFNSSKQ